MQRKFIWSLLFLMVIIAVKAQQPDVIIDYINTYKELAMQEMQRTGVPAAIKLAQGIHETQAGTSDLVKKSNNHFGIKCKSSWEGERVYHDDDARGECFRSYPRPDDSYRDHSDFLKKSPRYAFLFQLDPADYIGWAYGLKKAGYATNYRYSQILVKLIEDYHLEQYSLIAMGKLKPSDEIMEGSVRTSSVVTQAIDPVIGEAITETRNIKPELPQIQYNFPAGEFTINGARVVFVKAGTSLLSVAEQYKISFARLLDFNDLNNGDVLKEDQLVFLQRKRKTGQNELHVAQSSETLYDICQLEGVRLESLMGYNFLTDAWQQPANGEKIFLQHPAISRPLLASEKIIRSPKSDLGSDRPEDYTTHVVQTRETLYSISKKYGVSLEQIKNWNKLDSLDLKIGQQLVIHKNQ